VDYDAARDRLYLPLEGGYQDGMSWRDPFHAAGPSRLVSDPQFHQQNVYGVAMQVLGAFEGALGRRVNFGFQGHQLHVAPHAFAEANAYYQRENRCLLFGYYPDDTGRMVYTCLSRDVVAHETTHALLDGLRPRYIDPSSPDQAGFHEGFADVVALLSVLSEREIVQSVLTQGRGPRGRGRRITRAALQRDALKQSVLFGLAEQMGEARPNGTRAALRASVQLEPNRRWLRDPAWEEPHVRGEVLVAAVMQAYLRVWEARNQALLPNDGRYFDASRVVEEGVAAARHLLTMCIRALDYAPSTDLQYRDYLSALLTADKETVPDDSKYGYRLALRRAFASWGVRPSSRADLDGCWEPFVGDVSYRNLRFESLQRNTDEAFRFVWENFDRLKLSQDAYTEVEAVRPIARVAPDGLIVRETVIDYLQILTLRGHELGELGLRRPDELATSQSVRLYGGGVLVFDEFGRLKYSIGNNISNTSRQQRRLDYLAKSGFFDYRSDAEFSRGYFSRLHLARANDRWTPQGGRS